MTLLQFTLRTLIVAGAWCVAAVAVILILGRVSARNVRRDRRELQRSAERAYKGGF